MRQSTVDTKIARATKTSTNTLVTIPTRIWHPPLYEGRGILKLNLGWHADLPPTPPPPKNTHTHRPHGHVPIREGLILFMLP